MNTAEAGYRICAHCNGDLSEDDFPPGSDTCRHCRPPITNYLAQAEVAAERMDAALKEAREAGATVVGDSVFWPENPGSPPPSVPFICPHDREVSAAICQRFHDLRDLTAAEVSFLTAEGGH